MKLRLASTIVFCVLVGVCAVAVADEPQKANDKTVSPAVANADRSLQIYSLSNMRANDALAIVRDCFRDLTLTEGNASGGPTGLTA